MFRAMIVRGRVAMPITYSLIATMLSFSPAAAEYGIPAGGMSYPVDGSFVPVDAVSSNTTPDGGVALYQDAAQDASTVAGAEPATTDPLVVDAAVADEASEPAPSKEEVATDPTTDTASKEALADSIGSVDPAQDESTNPAPVDPAPPSDSVAPATGEPVDQPTVKEAEPAPVEPAPVAPALVDPAPSAAPAPPDTLGPGGAEPMGAPIATAYIAGTGGDGAPCLAAPEWGAGTLALLGEGESVEVRGETMGEWQPVNCAGAGGYVHVNLIAWTPTGPSNPVAAGGEQPGGKTGGAGEAVGEQIVSFALQFTGYPYVYAGEGPYAFDCSGFTMFVIHNTLGIDIPHDMFVQYQMGRSVSRDELQPGDIVFFQNTIRPGMSHDGIYIGGGQFVHAETESSGVTISDLDADYYRDRWYGAVRFG